MVDEDSTWTAGTDDDAGGGKWRAGALPATGSVFARHRIEAVIGRGGMGVVYRARNLALDRDRALKVIAPELATSAAFRARFQREARLAASLEHPNVVSVHDAGDEDGLLYLSMQLVDGADLSRLVERDGPLDPGRTARLVGALGSALDAAHARGMVHRDVKPSNVLIEAGEPGRVWLADFGITKALDYEQAITGTGEVVGSVSYAAPEQLEGAPPGPSADIYSLGCVAYFALTGEPPFPRADRIATLFAHANAPRPRASEGGARVPPAVDGVIARAMAIDPGERFGSAGEMATAFERAIGDTGRPAAAPSRHLGRPARARRGALIAAALLAAVVVGVVAVVLLDGDPAPDSAPSEPGLRAGEPIEVGRKPVGITVGERSVWVAYEDGVRAINPEAGAVIRRRTAIAEPHSVAVGFGSVWVASEADDAVYRVDQGSGVEPQRIAVGSRPADVAVDERWVWVALEGEDRVARIHPSSNEVAGAAPVGAGPRSLAVDRGIVWTANRGDGTVSRVRSRTAEPMGDPIPVGQRPNDIAAAAGSVWVVDNLLNTLTRLDAPLGTPIGDPVRLGPEPRGVAVGFGSVWVVTAGDDLLTRIDPEQPGAREAVEVGREPTDLALGEGSVWTADLGDGTVTRVRP